MDLSTLPSRFSSKIEPDTKSSCLLWTGAISESGYGLYTASRGKTVYAHRYLYELTTGPLHPGDRLVRSCDNRLCVNPLHLALKTPKT